ncbi:MAG: hypothetical protein HXN06_02310 [Porphyromonadaceae bacterium]|nr:hypothetical protein [Porphyromonadaceae bacterium]MBF1315001.1 hypothetical protein [Porphyromonadaceae bacterium]
MKKTALYQAIDGGRNAVPEVPIYCSTSEARLGWGYYFWDSLIHAAHWWGRTHYRDNYIICQSFYDAHSDRYFDLVGDLTHREMLRECADELRKRKQEDFSLAEVLELLKIVRPQFKELYWAIRAEAVNKRYLDGKLDIPLYKGKSSSCEETDISFAHGDRRLVVSCSQRVQVCVMNLAFLLEGEYRSVYPEYRDELYVV